jgi:peptidyl-prolyl cis-trans isomerase A (cyclophilin A)
MKKILSLIALTTVFTVNAQKKKQADGLYCQIETSKGPITLALTFEETPITVANFVSLIEGKNTQVEEKFKGKPFYNGIKFHRVIANFMIQGGCPEGNGTSGPGYKFVDEFHPNLIHNKAGVLSMANSGVGTNGSQFFITHKDTPWLDGKHTVFGHVISGQEVVDKIAQDDVINSMTIIRKGKAAKKFKAEKVFAAYFSTKEKNDQAQVEKNKVAVEKMNALKEAEKKKQAEIEAQKEKERQAAIEKEFANASTTPSGLKYIVIQEGTGNQPVATSNVKVHYTGMLLNGKIFDSSVQRNQTIDFGLNQVIPGWTEGVQLMKEGAKYKFLIPSNLAYGERGAGGVIPPNADLIFEIELIKINN